MRWSAGLVALLVAGAVLSGCAEPEAAAEGPSPTDAPERDRLSRPGRGGDTGDEEEEDEDDGLEDATVWSLAEEHDLTVTSATAVIQFGGFDGRNCIAVEGAPFRILGGNATLTWSAQSPAAEEMTVTVWQVYGDYYYEQAAGTSPLEMRFRELPTAPEDSHYEFSVEAGSVAGAAYEQDVHLSLALEYKAEDEVRTGPC